MGVVDRLARRVLDDGVPLDQRAVAGWVDQLIPIEAPLLDRSAAAAVVDTVLGLGPLEPFLRDRDVSDILVNSDGVVWIERAGTLERTTAGFGTPERLLAAIERVLAPLGLRLDRASPAVDARLPDGSRLHAVIPPAAVDGPVLAIRRFTDAVSSIQELVANDSIDEVGADLLRDLVAERSNVLVCGPTGSGKTTLLNVLSQGIPPGERIVTIEDAAELRLAGHVVRLECRGVNSEGAGSVTARDLLRHALRLRPDRIIVGEVRGAEAFDLLQALSTGHEGSMSTVHASSADEALWRLETLAMLEPAATAKTIHRQVSRSVDAVVVVGRAKSKRVVRGVWLIDPEPIEAYSCS